MPIFGRARQPTTRHSRRHRPRANRYPAVRFIGIFIPTFRRNGIALLALSYFRRAAIDHGFCKQSRGRVIDINFPTPVTYRSRTFRVMLVNVDCSLYRIRKLDSTQVHSYHLVLLAVGTSTNSPMHISVALKVSRIRNRVSIRSYANKVLNMDEFTVDAVYS